MKKIKRQKIISVILFLFSVSALGVQGIGKGIGIGSGSKGEDQVRQISAGVNPLFPSDLDSYMVYSEEDINSVLHWGSGSVSTIEQALYEASDYANEGKLEKAKKILKTALIIAAKNFPKNPADSGSPITQKLIHRSLQYLGALEKVFLNDGKYTQREKGTEFYFLQEYAFMIVSAWRDLDQDYYIPYYHRYHRCHPYHYQCRPEIFSYSDFSEKYIDYAKKELKFILDKFLVEANSAGYHYYKVPVGDEGAVLVLAEMSSRNVAGDIASTLWAYKNSFAVQQLMALNRRLSQFRKGNGGYKNVHKAINGWGGINSVFQQVISYLDEEDYHYDSYGRDHRNRRHCSYVITVEEELSGLSDYVEVSVSNTSTYVKGLIVSATAYGADAQVSVWSNRKSKGMMDIPQYDPKYSIPVKERIRDVRFHLTRGQRVRIHSIKVNYCE